MNGAFHVAGGEPVSSLGTSATTSRLFLPFSCRILYDTRDRVCYGAFGRAARCCYHRAVSGASPTRINPASTNVLALYSYTLPYYTINVAIGATSDYPALSRRYAYSARAGRIGAWARAVLAPPPSPARSNTLKAGHFLPRCIALRCFRRYGIKIIQRCPFALCFGHAVKPFADPVSGGIVWAREHMVDMLLKRAISQSCSAFNFAPRHLAPQFGLKISFPLFKSGFVLWLRSHMIAPFIDKGYSISRRASMKRVYEYVDTGFITCYTVSMNVDSIKQSMRVFEMKRLCPWCEQYREFEHGVFCAKCFAKIAKRANLDGLDRRPDLPHTLTGDSVAFTLTYWRYRCAFCDQPFAINHVRHLRALRPTLDHIIPLKSDHCPGTVIDNIIPVCSRCNTSKYNHDVYKWLKRKFGNKKAYLKMQELHDYVRIAGF